MFQRIPLNYQLNSLEPFIDYKTMNEHYNVHYKTYTEKLNEAILEDNIQTDSIIEILKESNKSKKLKNNAGGYYNHFLYFQNISPINNDFYTDCRDGLKNKIISQYGSYEDFLSQFTKVGLEVFGSGWVWLIEKNNVLMIGTTANQDNPLMTFDCKILLGMDVWEHAYYLKHMANRKSYILDFIRVIDWEVVSLRYEK